MGSDCARRFLVAFTHVLANGTRWVHIVPPSVNRWQDSKPWRHRRRHDVLPSASYRWRHNVTDVTKLHCWLKWDQIGSDPLVFTQKKGSGSIRILSSGTTSRGGRVFGTRWDQIGSHESRWDAFTQDLIWSGPILSGLFLVQCKQP